MRYLPLDASEREAMLARIGVPDIGALFADIPADKRIQGLLDMPLAKSEMAVERAMTTIASRSVAAGSAPFFLGAGAYRRHIPATVDHLIQRSEFLTSYTPYQPEIAQGTLQVLFEFQTQVAALTGMEVANASMYDGSTACGEAMLMAHRLTRRNRAVISGGLHPQYADVCATLAHMAGDTIVRLPPDLKASEDIAAAIDDETSCVIVQSPDFFGNPRDLAAHRCCGACARRASDRGLHRSGRSRRAALAGRDGRRHCGRRRAGARQRAQFRRPLSRPVRDARQKRAPDARASRRRDGRRGGAAQLRAHPLDPRAAHPPREGDEQHLHQFGPMRAGVLDPSDAARRRRTSSAWRRSITPTRCSSPGGFPTIPAVEVVNAHFFNEFTLRTPRPAAN